MEPEPRNWCVACGVHAASSYLCPSCLDKQLWDTATARVKMASNCRG